MVTIKDGCGCDPCDCDWKQKLKEAYARASVSVNKVGDFDGAIYYPDGTGFVKLPIPRLSEIQQISTNAQDIADLKIADAQLQANITRIDNTDTEQNQKIQDNADRINSTYNDLVATEATVATHDSEIITLQANNQALAKSLVSDVIMTDGTTAGSVQVSIEREDGALITSANYRWGRDIGIRLEAGTQAGYVKAVISLSDGTELVSNEYKIVEVLESDVYVTAITLVPDMTAGTIGGNISYSNGTTQTINSVSVPTAPGVTSAIEALQGRMTAVEQKNADQDASITAIDGRVQALENTPGIGKFANGRLGTIAGSTTDGRVKAEDDGTGSVNGWSALKDKVTAAEGQILALESSKVNIAQGAANAGKALVVGSDGNVAPGEISGGEVWEEVDNTNWPTDWKAGDRVKIAFNANLDYTASSVASSWTTAPTTNSVTVKDDSYASSVIEIIIPDSIVTSCDSAPIRWITGNSFIGLIAIHFLYPAEKWNTENTSFILLKYAFFNGAGSVASTSSMKTSTHDHYLKMWRLKK